MHQKTRINLEQFEKQINEPLIARDTWFLLDKAWYDKCKRYNETEDDSEFPGPINNCNLFGNLTSEAVAIDSRPLKPDLCENEDYLLIPESCWNTLKEAYGLTSSSHAVKRIVIETGPKHNVVEIYPLRLKLCLYGGKEPTVERIFSRTTKLQDLEEEMRTIFNLKPEKQTKLWISSVVYSAPPKTNAEVSNGSATKQLSTQSASKNNLDEIISSFGDADTEKVSASAKKSSNPMLQTLQDIGTISGSVVTIEVINNDGTWPSCRPRYGTVSTRSAKSQPGLCGLSNMGNTCFMNAALQCLSNTPPLTNYILADEYLKDINEENPLGMRGEIARTYAQLIKVIWSGNSSSFIPREFKCAVSTFAPQFTGFSQQDCQELMAFLLDGLHEDLNKIRSKPYIEIKNDLESRPDEVVAKESWSNYKKRNDSIVVDTFHGLLKSTLVCPGCNLVSVTFDPFCYLSLPLPQKRDRNHSSISSSQITTRNSDDFGASHKDGLQLEDCITQFTLIERLGAEDPWYCPKCKKHQQATKKFDIWSLPKVLIIHLKRFSFSRSWRDKIDTLVDFPLENLDMSKYVLNPEHKESGKTMYNLIGVANHFGGLGGGHYTAYAKNAIQNSWYTFDDAIVTPTSPANVVTKTAYVLFYQLQE